MKPLHITAIALAFALLCGCAAPQEPVYEPEISYVSVDEAFSAELLEGVTQCLGAVAAHDHDAVMQCTTEEFIWNYNETGFNDYCRNIESITDISVDMEHITENAGKYDLAVSYYVTMLSDEIEGGGQQRCGMVLEKSDNGWLVSSVSDLPYG